MLKMDQKLFFVFIKEYSVILSNKAVQRVELSLGKNILKKKGYTSF